MLINGIETKWHRPLACVPRRDAWATFSGEEGNGHFRNEVLVARAALRTGETPVPLTLKQRLFIFGGAPEGHDELRGNETITR